MRQFLGEKGGREFWGQAAHSFGTDARGTVLICFNCQDAQPSGYVLRFEDADEAVRFADSLREFALTAPPKKRRKGR